MNTIKRTGMRRLAFFSVAAVVAALALTAIPRAGADEHEHEDLPIFKHMEKINDHYKRLRREARRKRFDESTVQRVISMQEHSLAALHVETIPMAENLGTSAEKKKMMNGYRRIQAELMKTLVDLEIALREDRKDDAAEIISSLAEIKKKGHDKYTDDG